MKDGTIKTTCGLCHMGCGMTVTTRDGKIAEITGDATHPASRGYLCPKAFAIPEMLYSTDRLTKPLKKAASGKQVEISWDEAFDYAAKKILEIREKYGAKSILRCSGAPVNYSARDGLNALMNVIGSASSTGAASQCSVPRLTGCLDVIGERGEPDFEHANLIVLMGANPVNSNRLGGYCSYGPVRNLIQKARDRGCSVICVDPIFSETARICSEWVPIRCGTDAALCLAMISHIIKKKLYDQAFVDQYTIGFSELSEHVCEMTPEWAEKITNIPAETISRIAEQIANTKNTVICDGNGLDQYCNVVDSARAVAILSGITGNIDVPGGIVTLPFIPQARLNMNSDHCLEHEFPLFKELPFLAVKNAILRRDPEAPRALLVHHANPALIHANTRRTREALSKLDFLMIDDIFPTATTQLADLVLPAVSYFEHYAYRVATSFSCSFVSLARPIAEPPGEAKTIFEIEYEIARRMGEGENFPFHDDVSWIDYMLAPAGITFQQLDEKQVVYYEKPIVYRKYEKNGFATPSKKLTLYSQTFENKGHNPMPVYREPAGRVLENSEEFPLQGTSRRPRSFVHTKLHNINFLTEKHVRPGIWISPQDAVERNLTDGDIAILSTPEGQGEFSVTIEASQPIGLVAVEFGWGNPTDNGTDMNGLISDTYYDLVSGTTPNRLFSCQVIKK